MGLPAVQNEDRRAIGPAVLGKDFFPALIRAAEHAIDEPPRLVLRLTGAARGRRRRLSLGMAGTGEDLGAADEQAWIDAERPADNAQHHNGADTQPAAADGKPEPAPSPEAAFAAPILYVAAFRQVVQAHGSASWLRYRRIQHRGAVKSTTRRWSPI